MGKTEQFRKLGFGTKFPEEAIDMVEGAKIKMVSNLDEEDDLLVANRLYNDNRYLRNPETGTIRLISQGSLTFINETQAQVDGTLWIENLINRSFNGLINFPLGNAGTGLRRWDIVETSPGTNSLNVKNGVEAENPTKKTASVNSIIVFEVLWDENGIVFINAISNFFINKKYRTSTPFPSINTYACIFRQKPSANSTYLFKIDYLEFSSGIYEDYPPRNGKLHVSYVIDTESKIASNRVQIYTDTMEALEGDFVLTQNENNDVELYHRRNSFWSQLEFRVTINFSTVVEKSFLDKSIHGAKDLSGSTPIKIFSAVTSDHNTLTNIQGGTPTERFHITRPQSEAIEATNNPNAGNPFATMDDISDKITITEVKKITGYRIDLNTQGKDDLVQAINESNTWTVIEW